MDRIVRDLDVALARHSVEQPQDGVGVLPPVDVPDGAVLLSQVAELLVVKQRVHVGLLIRVGIAIALVDADVHHHVDRVAHVAVQVGVPALLGGGVHAAPRGVPAVGDVHLRSEVWRHELAREVLG